MLDALAHDVDSREERLAALRDLLASPGWRLLCEHAEAEWGPRGYGFRMNEAISAVGQGPDRSFELAQTVERVHHTAAAVNELVAWPKAEVAKLSPSARKPGLLDAVRRIPR